MDNFPSFLLIKDMPNCIGEIFFDTLINRMIMMDELMQTLRLGPSDTEETHQYPDEQPTCLCCAKTCGSDVFVDTNLLLVSSFFMLDYGLQDKMNRVCISINCVVLTMCICFPTSCNLCS